uniref:Dioxygenase large subunit n=1 Tax=uncultured bacterium UPO45 TaxID=1776970 RepID=A0A126SY29_9BACT|nr:dioxygenase large subunit [uncultured bacterium UPO45]
MKKSTTIDYNALVKADRIHGSVYTDPQIYEEEIDTIFHRGWVYVGHESEIPNPGDFRATTIGRQPVIMVRDDAGQVHLLLNRCTHRANAVCQVERGNTSKFRCAYHGWTFRTNGELASVTYQDRYDASFRKEDYGLRQVPRVDSYRGLIFGSLSPVGISLDEHLGQPAKEQIDLFIDLSPVGELDVTAGVHKYGYRANWKFQVENSMDGYHPNFVHQTFFSNIQHRTGVKLTAMFNSDSIAVTRDLGNGHVMLDYRPYNRVKASGLRAATMPTPWGQAYQEAMVAKHGAERAKEVLTAGGTHMLIFPNLVMLGVQIRVIRPIAIDQTEVFLYPALLKGVPEEVNSARLRAHEAFYGPAGGGATDDLEMFERNQLGLSAQLDPWLLLSRGIGKEQQDTDGTFTGQATDELNQRAIWRQWKKVMLQGAGGATRRVNTGARRHAQ